MLSASFDLISLSIFGLFFSLITLGEEGAVFLCINYSNVSHMPSVLISVLTAFSATLPLQTLVCVCGDSLFYLVQPQISLLLAWCGN